MNPVIQASFIPGVWKVTPARHSDSRGLFADYQIAKLAADLGHELRIAQHGLSISRRGAIRGIHYAAGQAKYITCVRGRVLDVVVDLRVGSPTFGLSDSVELGEDTLGAIYVPDGVGHGFQALTDDATMTYLCSVPYNPTTERGVHPLDLGIEWPLPARPLSERDTSAPPLRLALDAGLLPEWPT